MKKKMQVLVLLSKANREKWDKAHNEFKKYFEMEETFDVPKNIEKYLDNNVDILFMDDSKYFKISYYSKFQNTNQTFSYEVISDKPNETKDVTMIKNLVDRIIYSDVSEKHFEWTIVSSLRRYWNSYSKPSTIIYKGIIADFVESNYIVRKKKIELTPKEASLLRLFLLNKHKYLTKEEIFNTVWGHSEDNTRTVDQTFFKLKKKIGEHYFTSTRNKGILFE